MPTRSHAIALVDRVGFFGANARRTLDHDEDRGRIGIKMKKPNATMAEKVAKAARAFQKRSTGHMPGAVTVVLSGDTLVITMHDALTPAERDMAKSAIGATKVQEFHRQLFASSVESLRKEIKKITGVAVREAAAEVETSTGSVVQVFTSGTTVQVFQLAQGISDKAWKQTRRTKKS
jgi:uncharacterized protein YbcI